MLQSNIFYLVLYIFMLTYFAWLVPIFHVQAWPALHHEARDFWKVFHCKNRCPLTNWPFLLLFVITLSINGTCPKLLKYGDCSNQPTYSEQSTCHLPGPFPQCDFSGGEYFEVLKKFCCKFWFFTMLFSHNLDRPLNHWNNFSVRVGKSTIILAIHLTV